MISYIGGDIITCNDSAGLRAHFAPLLMELRQWPGQITLVKIKSHTGCLMNELADELAEIGRTLDMPELCPGPQKYDCFWLRIKPIVQAPAAARSNNQVTSLRTKFESGG